MRAPLFLLVAAAALSSAAVAQDLLQVGPHRYQWDASWGRPFEAGAFGAKGETGAAAASAIDKPRQDWVQEVSSIADVSWAQRVLS